MNGLTAGLNRRAFTSRLAGVAVALGAAGVNAPARALTPDRTVRFYVGFPPGGVADIVARIIVPPLAKRLAQTIVIDNRAGAGGTIGVEAIARSAPDGTTAGFGVSGALTSSVTLVPRLAYDPLKDIAPVSVVVLNPMVLVVPASLPVTSLKDFIASSRAAQGRFAYGTPGAGTAMHLAAELLKQAGGFEMTHAAYKGSSPAMTDLLGGHLQAAVLDLATVKPHLASGRVRVLGLTSARRTVLAPEIPTLAESGVPGYEFDAWFGMILPAGVPPALLSRWNEELAHVLREPAVRQQLLDAGAEPAPGTPAEMASRIRREVDITARLIKSAGIQVP